MKTSSIKRAQDGSILNDITLYDVFDDGDEVIIWFYNGGLIWGAEYNGQDCDLKYLYYREQYLKPSRVNQMLDIKKVQAKVDQEWSDIELARAEHDAND